VHAWRDAPVFPTPRGALRELAAHAPLPDHGAAATASSPGATAPQVLDAGCGMGDALIELHAAYPQARVHGIEWSWLWRAVAALRCPWARVRQGDMWAQSWAGFDLVYLFQRPETMPRAIDKAWREMRPGSWLVSLEFEAVDAAGVPHAPHARLSLQGTRPIWVYRIGLNPSGGPTTL
jgi:SAM-dependent methyltransferase